MNEHERKIELVGRLNVSNRYELCENLKQNADAVTLDNGYPMQMRI